jgi:hypothetical protein
MAKKKSDQFVGAAELGRGSRFDLLYLADDP